MTAPTDQQQDSTRRRRGAVRTALVLGVVAVVIYIGFILSGVLGAA